MKEVDLLEVLTEFLHRLVEDLGHLADLIGGREVYAGGEISLGDSLDPFHDDGEFSDEAAVREVEAQAEKGKHQ